MHQVTQVLEIISQRLGILERSFNPVSFNHLLMTLVLLNFPSSTTYSTSAKSIFNTLNFWWICTWSLCRWHFFLLLFFSFYFFLFYYASLFQFFLFFDIYSSSLYDVRAPTFLVDEEVLCCTEKVHMSSLIFRKYFMSLCLIRILLLFLYLVFIRVKSFYKKYLRKNEEKGLL